MDDIEAAVSFWKVSKSTKSSPNRVDLKLANQRDLSKFQTSQDLPHTVNIHVAGSSFRVNSLILALHSPVFEGLLFSGQDELKIDQSLAQLPDFENAFYSCLLFLHGKNVSVKQSVLELCFGFATVYEIQSLQKLCLEQFSLLVKDGEGFQQTFERIASKYPAPWRDTLLLSLLSTAHKDSPVISNLKNDTAKLLDLCRTVENSPLILGKLLWFLRDNELVPALKFTELTFLPKFLTLEDDSFSVVREFCIQITKDCVTMVTPPSTPPTLPTGNKRALPVAFSNSSEATKFFRQQMWIQIQEVDEYIAYGQAVSEVCKPENPYALFLYIDSFFIWFGRVPARRMNEGIRYKFLSSFHHKLIPAAVLQDIENVLDSMIRNNSNWPRRSPPPSNCSKELSYVSIEIDSSPEFQKILMQDQKLTVMVPSGFSVQVDFRTNPLAFQGRIATTRPIGRKVRFFYLISKGRHGESRWMSLSGTSVDEVANFLQKSTSVAVVLVLPKGEQVCKNGSKSANCSDSSNVCRSITELHSAEQVKDFIVNGFHRSLSSFNDFMHLISAAITWCGGDMTTYLCVEAMIEWNGGGKKVIKKRLIEILQNTALECTFLDDVFDELFAEKNFVSSQNIFLYSQNTFAVEMARVSHPFDHIKKSKCIPFLQNKVVCEVCQAAHVFCLTIHLDDKHKPLDADGWFNSQSRTTHLKNIRHCYLVIVRADGSFVRVPIGLKAGPDLFKIVEMEMRKNVPEFWLNVVYTF